MEKSDVLISENINVSDLKKLVFPNTIHDAVLLFPDSRNEILINNFKEIKKNLIPNFIVPVFCEKLGYHLKLSFTVEHITTKQLDLLHEVLYTFENCNMTVNIQDIFIDDVIQTKIYLMTIFYNYKED